MLSQIRLVTVVSPAVEVLDLVVAGVGETQPSLLDRVVGLAQRAEHPVGQRTQAAAMLPEAPGQVQLCRLVARRRSRLRAVGCQTN
jgi:hypothetical protein